MCKMTLINSECKFVRKELGRDPNSLEYGMLDIMFSEHCSYKSSRPLLKLFPTDGPRVILGPGDDAGIVELTDELALVIGMESHNHPSAIEPYGGAGTGIGGIIRDIISMGAMPIALLDSLKFGPLEDQRSRYIFEYVVKGISDYGNRVGIPTVGGEVEFDENFKFNPLVNVVCAGIVNKKDIVKGIAPNVGDIFVLMGGRTGRDGIHGVTFASEELTTESELEDRPAVQVGDPFTKKMVLEATLEALDKIDVVGLKDLGGGGLTCCVSEMAGKGGNGAEVELTTIPLRESGMTPYEIMLSESQERMVFVVKPEDVDALLDIFEKYELPAAVIGKVTEGEDLVIKKDGEIISKLKTETLSDPPIINREAKKPEIKEEYVQLKEIDPQEAILKLLSSPNIASKRWVYKQYDHEVQIRTAVKPGDDAAVLKIDDKKAIALTSDCNSTFVKLDPYHGGASAVAEAIRNVASMGAEPICIVDCLNFGNPEKPEVFWQFKECVKGMADVARAFETPVISGNVSFYNETEGVTVNPSPVVGVAGLMDIKNIRTLDFKNEGDKIILIGKTYSELDGSEYHKVINGAAQGNPPKLDIEMELESVNSVLDLIKNDANGAVTAVHDCSSGGLAIALAEMAISGDLGAVCDISQIPREDKEISNTELLFSESNARFVLTVKNEYAEEILNKINAPAAIIGSVEGKKLNVCENLIDIDVATLKESYHRVIENYMA